MNKLFYRITSAVLALSAVLSFTSCSEIEQLADNAFITSKYDTSYHSTLIRSEKTPELEKVEEPPEEKGAKKVIEKDYHADDTFEEDNICVNNSDYLISDELTEAFNTMAQGAWYKKSYYAIDLETGMSIGYNGDEKVYPACALKTGVALYVTREISLGHATMDDLVTYEEKHFISGTGLIIRQHSYGEQFSVHDLLDLMITESDNCAYYMLIDYFGYDGYNEMMKQLGCEHELHEGLRGHWAPMSAHELGLVWLELYKMLDYVDEAAYVWDLLSHNKYNFIYETLVEYAGRDYETIVQKSGYSESAFTDAGIVMGEHPYVIVVLVQYPARTWDFINGILYIDDIMNEYQKYLSGEYVNPVREEETDVEDSEEVTDISDDTDTEVDTDVTDEPDQGDLPDSFDDAEDGTEEL